MRTAASFKSHPIHASLIPFPFAFLLGACAFDVAGRLFDVPAFWQTGRHLTVAGIAAALVAAIPGFVDYVRSVPPRSSGKTRATKHMLLNLGTVGLFVGAFVVRDVESGPDSFVLLLEVVAACMLLAAGWMGGTLVARNQIGVDHRYAAAGQWKEASFESRDSQPLLVGSDDELDIDQMKLLHVDGERIVLARSADGYVAFADRCTHRGASLGDGVMICGVVQCPWHGSQFDVHTGAVRAGPANAAIETYPVRVDSGDVLLDLSDTRRPNARRAVNGAMASVSK